MNSRTAAKCVVVAQRTEVRLVKFERHHAAVSKDRVCGVDREVVREHELCWGHGRNEGPQLLVHIDTFKVSGPIVPLELCVRLQGKMSIKSELVMFSSPFPPHLCEGPQPQRATGLQTWCGG